MDENDDDQYSAATRRQNNARPLSKYATYSKRRYTHGRSPAKSNRKRNQHFEKLDQPIAIVNDASKDVSTYNFLENHEAAKGDSARKRKAFSRPFKQVDLFPSLLHSNFFQTRSTKFEMDNQSNNPFIFIHKYNVIVSTPGRTLVAAKKFYNERWVGTEVR